MDRRKALVLVTFCTSLVTAGSGPGSASAAEFKVKPSAGLSEEYNDNILETASDRQSDFITRVRPGVSFAWHAPRLTGDLDYSFDYRNYARGSRGDEKTHAATANASAELVQNFFYLSLNDTLSRVSLDVARDVTADSLFLNQTDQNRAYISPYLVWRPGQKTRLTTGYRYTDTRYWTVSGNPSGIDKTQHTGFAELGHEPMERLSLTASYSFSSVHTDLFDYDQHDLSAGFRSRFGASSFVYGGVGNSWQSYSDTRDTSSLFWNAGVSGELDTMKGVLEASVRYTEDPRSASTKETSYRVTLEKTLSQGALGASLSHSKFRPVRKEGEDREQEAVSAFLSYGFTSRLDAALAVAGDRLNRSAAVGYPYHLNGSVALSYGFNHDLGARLVYSYVEYRKRLGSSDGARQTNRVALELKKDF